MNLKEYTPENCPADHGRDKHPFISLTTSKGLFYINKPACDLIGLQVGDGVKFLNDQEEKQNWYIEKVDTGFILKDRPKAMKGLIMNNKKVMDKIIASAGFTGKSGRLLVAGKPTEIEGRKLWGLLTNGLKNK